MLLLSIEIALAAVASRKGWKRRPWKVMAAFYVLSNLIALVVWAVAGSLDYAQGWAVLPHLVAIGMLGKMVFQAPAEKRLQAVVGASEERAASQPE